MSIRGRNPFLLDNNRFPPLFLLRVLNQCSEERRRPVNLEFCQNVKNQWKTIEWKGFSKLYLYELGFSGNIKGKEMWTASKYDRGNENTCIKYVRPDIENVCKSRFNSNIPITIRKTIKVFFLIFSYMVCCRLMCKLLRL